MNQGPVHFGYMADEFEATFQGSGKKDESEHRDWCKRNGLVRLSNSRPSLC